MSKADLTVSATEARRSFSKLLLVVQDGGRVTITSHGKPVAELNPVCREAAIDRARLDQSFQELQDRLARTPDVTVGPWTRDSLYDD